MRTALGVRRAGFGRILLFVPKHLGDLAGLIWPLLVLVESADR